MERQSALKFAASREKSRDSIERLSFVALYVFALLLYLRPQEMFPSVFGTFLFVKLVSIFCLTTFIVGRLWLGRNVTICPISLNDALPLLRFSRASFDEKSAQIYTLFDKNDWLIKAPEIYLFNNTQINTSKHLTSIQKVTVKSGS